VSKDAENRFLDNGVGGEEEKKQSQQNENVPKTYSLFIRSREFSKSLNSPGIH
jgi:hypothetical protein